MSLYICRMSITIKNLTKTYNQQIAGTESNQLVIKSTSTQENLLGKMQNMIPFIIIYSTSIST